MSAVYPPKEEREDSYEDEPRSIIEKIRESIDKIRYKYVCEADERIKEKLPLT